MADFGTCLTTAGRNQEAVEILRKAMQINPHYPDWWLMIVAQIYFDARLYEETVKALARVQELNISGSCLYLAASHAALLLAQGAGRLLRRSDDRGVVAVLDSRMATAGYAGFLRASLPPFWATTDSTRVREALARLREP